MSKLLEEISTYIKNLFETQLSPSFVYHNFQHTKDVVDAAKKIAENSGIPDGEKELLLIAAWFHDSGYCTSVKYHEEISTEIAGTFLKKENYPSEKTDIVKRIILSTKIPQHPQTKLEEILCDADLVYLGYENLDVKIELLRKEWESTINKFYTDREWLKQNIDFIDANSFHTDYAREIFGAVRMLNLNKLKYKAEAQDKTNLKNLN